MTDPPPLVTIADGPSTAAPIVLLHGFLESPSLWRDLPPRLWADRHVVSLPLPGHAPWRTTRTGLAALLEDDAFLDCYAEALSRHRPGTRWRLVGHSTGAMVALALARRHPNLVDVVCAVAPLLSGSVCARGLQGAVVRLPMVGLVTFRWLVGRWLADAESFAAGLRTVTGGPTAPLPRLEGMQAELAQTDLECLYRFGCWIGTRDMEAHLATLRHPVLAMVCDHDPVIDPRHQLRLIRAAPLASAVVLRSGHLPMFETPRAFARVFAAWRDRPQERPGAGGSAVAEADRERPDETPAGC
ncbi:MAG: alpha/beta hydrolase [Rhodobacteraceae bacterium]|nr:alpha/beta hydrolase [Paracoccaceae bacterium]